MVEIGKKEILVLYKMYQTPDIDIKDATVGGESDLFGEQVEIRREKYRKKHFEDTKNVQLSGPLK